MAVSPKDYISSGIYFFDEYDVVMSTMISHHVRPGQTVWDVGSERGWFTLLMANIVGESGRVDSFEALPSNAKKLSANVELNGMSWVNVNAVAVSSAESKMWFVPPSNEVTNHISFLQHCGGVGYLADTCQPGAIEVPTTTLDVYAEQTGVEHLSFVKLDIEGAEVSALRGAQHVLRRCKPVIAVEYNRVTARRAGSSIEELDELLDSYGYDRFVYSGRFSKLNLANWKGCPEEQTIFDVYCFPRSGQR
jgi:FkbM family methyltransferase